MRKDDAGQQKAPLGLRIGTMARQWAGQSRTGCLVAGEGWWLHRIPSWKTSSADPVHNVSLIYLLKYECFGAVCYSKGFTFDSRIIETKIKILYTCDNNEGYN